MQDGEYNMALYVYTIATGALVSWCPFDTDPVAPAGQLVAQGMRMVKGLPVLDATHVWSPTQLTVVTQAAPVLPIWIPTYQFIMLFTPAEHASISASSDPKVTQFMRAMSVSQQINLNDPLVQGGVAYLVTINLLTQTNATLILSGQPSQ